MGNAAFSSMSKYQNKYRVSIYKYSYPYLCFCIYRMFAAIGGIYRSFIFSTYQYL